MHRQFEAIAVSRLPHGAQARRHAFGIAVQAALADLGAAGHRVPRAFSPLDPGKSQGLLLQYFMGNLDRQASASLVRCSEAQKKHRAISRVSQEQWILCNSGKQGPKAREKKLLYPVEVSVLLLNMLFTEQAWFTGILVECRPPV
jgi:hypothetical protein